MRRRILFLVIILVPPVLWALFFRNKGGEEEYRKISPSVGDITLSVSANGTVKPRNRLQITPPVSGRIEDIFVKEGNRVKKGDILAVMSSLDRAALLDAARARGEDEVKRWEDVYKPTPVLSPLDGFIIRRDMEPGQSITTSDPILTMADKLIVQAQVDETDMGKLLPGQSARIYLDAYPGRDIEGVIEHIAFESEVINNVTIYQVDIKPLKDPGMLRSGMSANIDIILEKKEGIIMIPAYSITRRRRRTYVLVEGAPGYPEERNIETGIEDGENVEIVSGVSEKDIVLVKPSADGSNRFGRRFSLPGMGGR